MQPSLWNLRRNFYLYHQNLLQYFGSFSVGLLLGYALIVNESSEGTSSSDDDLSKKAGSSRGRSQFVLYNTIAWLTIVVLCLWVNRFFSLDQSFSEVSVLLFMSLGRLAFILSFAWLCYALTVGKSGELMRENVHIH